MLGVLLGVVVILVMAIVGGGALAWASQVVGQWLGLAPFLVLVGAVGIFLGLAVHFAADHVLSSLRGQVQGLGDWLVRRGDGEHEPADDEPDGHGEESAATEHARRGFAARRAASRSRARAGGRPDDRPA